VENKQKETAREKILPGGLSVSATQFFKRGKRSKNFYISFLAADDSEMR
jgi:hypothetical protein